MTLQELADAGANTYELIVHEYERHGERVTADLALMQADLLDDAGCTGNLGAIASAVDRQVRHPRARRLAALGDGT
jgi:hypothetical protein